MNRTLVAIVLATTTLACAHHEVRPFASWDVFELPYHNDPGLVRGTDPVRGEAESGTVFPLYLFESSVVDEATLRAAQTIVGTPRLVDGTITIDSVNYGLYKSERAVVQGIPLFDPAMWTSPSRDVGVASKCSKEREPFDPPIPIRRPPPRYPENALRKGIGGRVLIQYEIQSDGTVANAHVVASEPSNEFNQAALASVRSWEFCPVPESGGEYPNPKRVAIPFALR